MKTEDKDLKEFWKKMYNKTAEQIFQNRKRRIRRICKAAQMICYLYQSDEADYRMVSSLIHGNMTLPKLVEAVNHLIPDNKPLMSVDDRTLMDSLKEYESCTEKQFHKLFKFCEGYDYSE